MQAQEKVFEDVMQVPPLLHLEQKSIEELVLEL